MKIIKLTFLKSESSDKSYLKLQQSASQHEGFSGKQIFKKSKMNKLIQTDKRKLSILNTLLGKYFSASISYISLLLNKKFF